MNTDVPLSADIFKLIAHLFQFFFSLYLKINIGKTSEKVTKGPKRVEAARKGREKYMNKLKESILNYAKKGSRDTTNTSNETTSPTTNASNETTSPTTDAITIRSNVELIFIALVHLLSLPLAFAYFLHIKLPRLQTKDKS